MKGYDSIVVGAGHNGLVCATMLARTGQSVLLLEAAESVGGLAANREFYPGFKVPVAHAVSQFRKTVANELKLESHGLESFTSAQPTIGLSRDGNHIILDGDTLLGAGDADHEAFTAYRKQMRRFAGALEPFWLKTIPRIGIDKPRDLLTFAHMGLNLRRLGKADMGEFMRVFSLPMRDLMDEYFESELLKALLSWDGLIGSKMAPRSPNSAVLTLLYRMGGKVVNCEVSNLVKALESAAIAAGVEIRTGARVDRIRVDGDGSGLRATGVRLQDGEECQAERVVSSADPRTTFLKLVGVENLEIGFTSRISHLRCNGYVAKCHLALDKVPTFTGVENTGGRMIIAPELDAIEFAYDDAKYGEWSQHPVMEISLPSVTDATLASSGHHVLSAHVMYVPYELKGGWNDTSHAALTEKVIGVIETYAPGIRDCVVASELLTPADIERDYGATGGHWHHAEMAADQMLMMRPTYEAAQYSTPIPGLYLCGAGSHPGGDLTGAPGFNAAREILK